MGATEKQLSDDEIRQNKSDKITNAILKYAAYYRANPQRWVEEYLGIKLKLFQKILIYAMNVNDMFLYIASRGQGKSFLVAIYAVFRCVCYPHTQCVVASYTFKQGKEIVNKITNTFMHNSPLLRYEIEKVTTGQNDCFIFFKNGSWIKVVTATESARGTRSNLLIVDESRLVPQKIVDTILRPMNADPRQVGYLNKPEYEHLKEMNKEIHMSSAWYVQSELYDKLKTYFANMLNPNLKYFACDLPYQLSIKEGLLMKQQIENEMSEATFSDVSFTMERAGLFYGSSEDSLFDFKVLNNRRILTEGLYPLEYYKDNNVKIPEKQKGELRVLSLDVALLASKKHRNDASCFIVHSAMPTKSNDYIDNLVYIDTAEGFTTEELGLETMRKFYQYDCDYLVIDSNGVGMGVLDYVMGLDRYDPLYNETYGALNVINNPELEDRCRVSNAPKVIYAIKASTRSNNDMVLSLRSGFQNGYINLLTNETNADNYLTKIKGYSKLPDTMKAKLKLPYVQTTFLIDEMINLNCDSSSGMIKVKEKTGMRKDRFSSCEYGWYAIQEQAKKLRPNTESVQSLLDKLIIKPAHKVGSF